jgi:hypothetical protein
MRKPRFSIAGLMGTVLVAAIGLAALKNASEAWAGGMFLLACVILALALVGAIVRGGDWRAWWLGFSFFGWGYMALWRCDNPYDPFTMLPTTTVLESLGPRFGFLRQIGIRGGDRVDPSYIEVGQCLWTLLTALLGGLLASLSFASPRGHSDRFRLHADGTPHPPRNRWLPPTIIGLVVLIGAGAVATIWSGPNARLWAGLTFTLTWALIGLAILGAVADRGGRRATWLGAAIFSTGYMALIFSGPAGQPPRAYLPTDPILEALRPWFPPLAASTSSEDARIREALERPIPMRFPNETPFEDVLKSIERATSTPTRPGIPIRIERMARPGADVSLNPTVSIDLEGVRLKTTLGLCLKQLGCTYSVRDGFLQITTDDDGSSDSDDPFLVVGHCVLALLAAGFGALAAPMVAEARNPSTSSSERT